MDSEQSLSLRAAWLAYVGGYTQEQIADRLTISRVKAHRLIAAATQNGLVKFWIEGVPTDCIALEEELMKAFGLKRCTVVPSIDENGEPGSEIAALAVAAARTLARRLESGELSTVGVGHGRTLAAMVERLPHLQLPNVRFVSMLGSLTRSSAANPYDVIARLTERTGGECFFLPVPFIADSSADARVLVAQSGVQHVFELIRACQLCVVGIGDLGPDTHLQRFHSITPEDRARLLRAGAVGELAGRFVDAQGTLVDSELNERAVGVSLDDLRGRDVLGVAGGTYKTDAIRAVLRSGVLTALIVDEATAKQVLRPAADAC
ncbi:sugar-binding transcriptional regulator (plasmid) [Burkholderia humptydooensis]|uniref:Sugar-binding transcriptional regulator n=2 Tax=Burkholderia humptydooensis TaxID=430531 RepID=A0A7U4STC9_9BURK|nr:MULTISPECIES: sugar-binding transcriptional regulator [Burkholderia]AJY38160.1 putative sugar-binding domain protein [Burkholderia sp. 2002721687]ALX44616.1 DeoR family transcriptional regulator [Burkholderia humptydooensis]EIP84958.1 transcriptional regulator, DeoR family protein [Burkholderia humptydooensis MSMB43]QPS42002.1 sugar-binding transcriptional regulator [Burkholderia humptydooensis]